VVLAGIKENKSLDLEFEDTIVKKPFATLVSKDFRTATTCRECFRNQKKGGEKD
jgi:hypothetical protein